MGLLDRIRPARLVSFQVEVGGLRLRIQAPEDRTDETRTIALHHFEQLESYLAKHSSFQTSYVSVPVGEEAPPLVRAMGEASEAFGVGPMVTLPGALAEAVARDLGSVSRQVIVSIEGDNFVITKRARTFVVEPSPDPEGGGLAVRVRPNGPYAFYCSTGRVRIDPVIGRARAVAVLADHGALADAAGSAMGSAMHRPEDVDRALEVARGVGGVRGAVILVGGRIGVWGDIEILTPAR